MAKDSPTGFWDEEDCEYCGGPIREKRVDLTSRSRKRLVLVRNIPAGVCTRCGVRYYAANVLKTVEERVRRGKPRELLKVPVVDYIASSSTH